MRLKRDEGGDVIFFWNVVIWSISLMNLFVDRINLIEIIFCLVTYSVIILLCRKAAYLLVIISMRLKIDQVMLRASIVIADKDYHQDGVQDIILMRLKLEII